MWLDIMTVLDSELLSICYALGKDMGSATPLAHPYDYQLYAQEYGCGEFVA